MAAEPFNGATAFQRWKRRVALQTNPPVWLGPFNGATAFQRWKLGWLDGGRYGCRPFNGATAFQRWKRRVGDETRYGCRPFNGATAFQRWETAGGRRETPVWLSTLQWGHRLSAMETAGGRRNARYGCRPFNGATAFQRWKRRVGDETPVWLSPSMGPPPFSDGNVRMGPTKPAWLMTLQWGHRLSAMETTAGETETDRRLAEPTLQWGHRLSAMETGTVATSTVK